MPYIPRDPFVQHLWRLDFVFIFETNNAHVYRRGYQKVIVPKVEQLDAEWARGELHRIGLGESVVDMVTRAA